MVDYADHAGSLVNKRGDSKRVTAKTGQDILQNMSIFIKIIVCEPEVYVP